MARDNFAYHFAPTSIPMGGVISGFGGPVNTTCFTDSDAEAGSMRLAAVVIWRRPPAAASPRVRVLPGPWHLPDGWSGGRSDDGREVLYHRERRVVRVLERDFPIPATGEALLLLIDDGAPGKTAPAVGVHTLAAPVYVRPPIDRTLAKPARLALLRVASRAEHDTWGRAIAGHPAVQAFLEDGSGDHAT